MFINASVAESYTIATTHLMTNDCQVELAKAQCRAATPSYARAEAGEGGDAAGLRILRQSGLTQEGQLKLY